MDLEPYNFPENTLLKLISPLSDTFKIKTPKISINRTMNSMKIKKEDGINELEENKISKIYTPEEQSLKNISNINLYKNFPPKNILVYSDNENDPDELSLLGHPVSYDFLLKILQCDLSNIENFIDEKNGNFIDDKSGNCIDGKNGNFIDGKNGNFIDDNNIININNNISVKNKLIYIDESNNENEAKIIYKI